jgi:hypothetical protein
MPLSVHSHADMRSSPAIDLGFNTTPATARTMQKDPGGQHCGGWALGNQNCGILRSRNHSNKESFRRERAMSLFSGPNNTTAAFRSYSPGPHSGVGTDPDAHVDSGSIDSRARNALTLGVLSLILGVLTGIPAIWVGRKALVHINAANGTLRGRWAAWTGIVLGCLGVAITIGLWIYLHQH